MEVVAFMGAIIAVIGSLFLLLASIGLIRMPDFYSRMQAGTKATTLGTILLVSGLAMVVPSAWTRLLVLGVFVFITNPVSSHTLSRSAHYQGINPLDITLKNHKFTGSDALKTWKDAQGVTSIVQKGADE